MVLAVEDGDAVDDVARARRERLELLREIDLRYIHSDLVPAAWELALQRQPLPGDDQPTAPLGPE